MLSRELVRSHLLIDSSDRDIILYPSAASYCILLPEVIKDVVGIALVHCVFPKSQPIVNDQGCWIDFKESGNPSTFSFCLGTGNVSGKSLVLFLNTAFTGGPWTNTYTVAIDPLTSRLSITAGGSNDVPFQLLFGTGPNASASMAFLLGFQKADSAYAMVQTGQCHVNLSSSLFVDVAVEEAPRIATKQVIFRRDGSMGFRNVIARIPLDVNAGQIKYYYADRCEKLNGFFQPLKLDRLTISLVNDQSLSYIPDGLDHSMMFEVTQLLSSLPDGTTRRRSIERRVNLVAETPDIPRPVKAAPKDKTFDKTVVAAAAVLGLGGAAYYLLGKDPEDV